MMKPLLATIALACLALPTISLAHDPFQSANPNPADKTRLVKLQKAYDAATRLLAKRPGDPKARRDFVQIGVAYGTECMTSAVLDRKVKYRLALHIYRQVLKVDPHERTAKGNSDEIIAIYKQMGRPVPSG